MMARLFCIYSEISLKCVFIISNTLASKSIDELCGTVQTWWAALLEAPPRQFDLHHQPGIEPCWNWLRRWRLQFHPLQLHSQDDTERMDAYAPRKIDPLSWRTLCNQRHSLHYDFLCGPLNALLYSPILS